MNVQEYISSDILDRYVLGDVSEQEKKEVDCMSHIYPEIRTALDNLQESINQYTLSYEKAPPVALKGKIMAEIEKLNKQEFKNSAKIISLPENEKTPNSSKNTYKWLVAASVILFLVTAFLYANERNKLSASQTETTILADKLQQMSQSSNNKIVELKSENELIAMSLALFNKPQNKIIKMAGIEKIAPNAHATICWNAKTKEVYVGFLNLPPSPANKQYQLWAIDNGKPVDLGVIDKTTDTLSIQKMKPIENAQAFAVTLEKFGGNTVPTLEEMYTLGSAN